MPQPTQSQSHYDAILSNISTAYMQEQDKYIATKVFPVVQVDKQSNRYYTYTKHDWFRDEAKVRADATESAGGGYTLSTDSYACDVYAFHKDVGDQVLANSDAILDPFRSATELVTQRLLLRMEIDWVNQFFVTGKWGTSTTPANLWSDYAASDPIGDTDLARETILINTGKEPNTMVMGYHVYNILKSHPDLVDRLKYTSSDVVGQQMMAKYFEIDKLFVSKAVYSTSVEGTTTPLYAYTAGDHALMCYTTDSPGLLEATAGYTFSWNGGSMAGAAPKIKRYRMEQLAAERVEGEVAWDQKIVATDLGYMFVQVVT
jgi:hypothetical protein